MMWAGAGKWLLKAGQHVRCIFKCAVSVYKWEQEVITLVAVVALTCL